ncbi:MAG: hypothetical protein Alpg2KO_16410 [Alphaproteobacteria bacterium]
MTFRSRKTSKRGVTATSYGLVVGLIAIVALVAVDGVGSSVTSLFTTTSDTLASATGPETASAPPAPSPTPDMLEPGNTTKTVTRDGFEVRCLNWSGDTCRVPQINVAQATDWLSTATEYGTNTPLNVWRELSFQTPGHEERNAELFCYWATGDHSVTSATNINPATFGYTPSPDEVFIYTYCSVFSNVRPCYEGDYTNPSSGDTWEITALTLSYTPSWVVTANCTAWQ